MERSPRAKVRPFFLVHRNLSDAAHLIFDGIFDGDDLVLVVLDLVDGGIQRGGLSRSGWPGYQNHSIGLVNVAAEMSDLVGIEAHDVEGKVAELLAQRFLVQNAQDGVFAVHRGHDGNAEVDEAALVADPEAPVLRHAPLGNVQLAHDLDARKDGGVPVLGQRLHGELQNAVDAVLDDHLGVARFDVDITRAPLESGEDDGVHQAHHRAHAGFPGELLHGDVLVAVFVLADHLERESLGGFIQHALRLFGALEEVADLRGGSHLDLQALAQKQRQLIGEMQLARIRHGHGKSAADRFQGDEVVAEHHFRRDAAKQLGIDALLAKVDKTAAIALRQTARLEKLGCIARRGRSRYRGRCGGLFMDVAIGNYPPT